MRFTDTRTQQVVNAVPVITSRFADGKGMELTYPDSSKVTISREMFNLYYRPLYQPQGAA